MIGETIGHYRIVAEKGRGSMGVVYQAEDTHLRCNRALKFLHNSVTPDSPDHIRLVNEARALATLEHPNICPVQEIGEHNGQTFFVMSYLEGRTLKERLDEGPVPLDEALEIARQISAGLAAAHDKGVVHRDVKPENVMLIEANGRTQSQLRVVLMDFGIAKKRDTTLLTRTGTIMGTAAYMSPEQANGTKVEAASDVWAVGVLLYEMLAGQRPFKGDIEPALLYAIVVKDPEPLVGAVEKVPQPVERVIGKALAKDVGNRYANATELLADIDRVIAGEAVKGRRLKSRRLGPLVTAATAVIGFVLVALFVWPGFLASEDAISSLAVMPLEDRSGDDQQAYFVDGVSEELEIGLSKIGALTIVSSSSAAKARELYDSNREIGERLGVGALIEGSVQRDGDQVRMSVRLVAIDDDRLLWSESYTRNTRDILNLQNEISLAISSALETELTPKERERLSGDREIAPEAFEEYLLAKHFLSLTTPKSCEQAIEHFNKALAIEPDYARAHIALVEAYGLHQQMADLPPSAVNELIKEHVEAFQRLEPESATFEENLGWDAMLLDHDLQKAGVHFARARELDPNLSMIGYAQYLNMVGRHQDALRDILIAGRQEPLNPFTQANVAGRYARVGQYEEALDLIERIDEWEPDFWVSLWVKGCIQVAQGDPAGAVESFRTSVTNSGDSPAVKPNLAHALVLAGRQQEAMEILEEFEQKAEDEYVSGFIMGLLYSVFGKVDEAFVAFNRGADEEDFMMFNVSGFFTSPQLRTLESDPRWPELLARMGLPML